jgi:outer membrane protein OmpA-like peptidoglycan-associated protein
VLRILLPAAHAPDNKNNQSESVMPLHSYSAGEHNPGLSSGQIPGRSIALSLLLLLSVSGYAVADDRKADVQNKFSRTFYGGVGVGASVLEPNTDKIDGWDVTDSTSGGGQINIGVDLSRQLSLEVHSTDLGSAQLSPSGRIEYHIDGISALIYAGGARNRYKRRGFSAYGRGGVGILDNTPVGNVPFRTLNDRHWLIGAGLEYMHRNGFGARAEVISFDTDAKYGQLGMIYRFGREQEPKATGESRGEPTQSPATVNLPAVIPPPPPPPPSVLKPPATSVPQPVADTVQCAAIQGELEGIRFDTGSSRLTQSAERVLDDLARTLAKCPQVPIYVSAHTDSQGSAKINKVLSQRRAWAVINYLRGVGISLRRLIPRAYGETQPVDTNNTAEGRRNNRRVELIAG